MSRLVLAVLLVSAAFISRAEDENPYKSAKVGDWVEYKTTTEGTGFKMESKMKQSVSAKTDAELTLKVETEANGQKHASEQKIDLSKKYEPNAAANLATKPTVEKVKEGDETVSVGGKDYKTHFVENKTTMDVGGQKMVTESKVWTSKDAPLSGMVKVETKMGNGMKSTMELTGSGKGQ